MKRKPSKAYFKKASMPKFFSSVGAASQSRSPKSQKIWHLRFCQTLFLIFLFLLPTQLGRHFFPSFSYLNGVRVDYLAPTVYLTDVIVFFLFIFNAKSVINFFKSKTLFFGLGLILVNVFLAKNQMIAFYRFAKIIEFLVAFSLGGLLFKTIKEEVLLVVLLFTGGFQLVLATLQLVFRHSLQGIFYFFGERLFSLSTPGIAKAALNGIEFLRPYGTFSHPNSLAGFFLLLYFFVLTNKNFTKYLFLKYFSLFIFSILIFISFSKVAILTLIILNTLYWILNTRIKCLPCKISRIFIPAVISLVFLRATTDPLTVEKRLELIKNSLDIWFNKPFFGIGLGNYLIAQAQYSSKHLLFFNQPVHNIFLLFFSEAGIITGSIIIILIFNSIKHLIKVNPYIILAVVLTGLFDHYWLTLEQNFLLLALVYGSVSSSLFISKFNLRSSLMPD